MALADLDLVKKRIVWILGSHNGLFNATVYDDRFHGDEIQAAIFETEAELVKDICENYHPARMPFLGWSVDLASGALIPAHIGNIEEVRIKKYSGASTYDVAQKTTRTNILRWRENHNQIFDALGHNVVGSKLSGYYAIHNETIEFTGYMAQARIATYAPTLTPSPTLQIDRIFQDGLISGTIARLTKVGVEAEVIQANAQIYANVRQGIQSGLASFPDKGQKAVAVSGE